MQAALKFLALFLTRNAYNKSIQCLLRFIYYNINIYQYYNKVVFFMESQLLEFFKFFAIYFVELSLLFVIVSVLIAFLNNRYKSTFEKHLGKDSYLSYIKAILLGSLTPFCSCSTIPLLRALLKTNVVFGVCIAYLLTSPLVNPIIVGMLFVAFGLKITLIYVAFLFVAIFILSTMIQKLDTQKFLQENFKSTNHNDHFKAKKPINFTSFSTSVLQKYSSCCDTQMNKNMSCCTKSKNKDSIKNLFFQSLKDYKKLVPYIAIGMGIGAFIHGFVPQDFLQNYLGGFGILNVIFAAFIGILLYVRVEAIIPIGVALLGVGVNEGVIMSFLIAGAGCSLPELILLKSIFKLNFLALFVGLVLCIAIGFGMIIYFL